MHDHAVSRTGRAVAWVAWVMVAVFAVGWVVMVALAYTRVIILPGGPCLPVTRHHGIPNG